MRKIGIVFVVVASGIAGWLTPGSVMARTSDQVVRDRIIQGPFPADQFEKAAAATIVPDGDGHFVSVKASKAYQSSPAKVLAVVGFLGSLRHGDEMNRLKLYVATPSEMRRMCGADADACYYPDVSRMVIGGEKNADGLSTEYVTAHEFGHHIANYLRNDPWDALDWGSKRWSTYENVCSNVKNGRYFPYSQGRHYWDNPGEAYAEAYAMSDPRFGRNRWDWNASLRPDATSFDLISQDIEDPWAGNTRTVTSVNVRRFGSVTRWIDLPLDGTLAVQMSGPPGADFDLALRTGSGRVLRQAKTAKAIETVRFTVCGQSRLKFTVSSYRGSGAADVSISKP